MPRFPFFSTLLLAVYLIQPGYFGQALQPIRRSSLFLDDSFVIGLAPIGEIVEQFDPLPLGNTGSFLNTAQQSEILLNTTTKSLSPRSSAPSSSSSTSFPRPSPWPGHSTTPLSNPSSSVTIAFSKNLATYTQKASTLRSQPTDPLLSSSLSSCNRTCTTPLCLISCSGSELLRDLPHVLSYSLRALCRTSNTLYTRLDALNIKSLKSFQTVMDIASNYLQISLPLNVAVRSTLLRLANLLPTTLIPFRQIATTSAKLVKPTEGRFNLRNHILVGSHPGCSMVPLTTPTIKSIEAFSKSTSLVDYTLFQGYTLFTATTKYLSDFPTKREFSSLNTGLDLLIGTTCGILTYATYGTFEDCDQYGGYPVLDNLIPPTLWSDKDQVECMQIRAKLVSQAGASSGSGGGAPAPASGSARKRRGLVMTGNRKGNFKR